MCAIFGEYRCPLYMRNSHVTRLQIPELPRMFNIQLHVFDICVQPNPQSFRTNVAPTVFFQAKLSLIDLHCNVEGSTY